MWREYCVVKAMKSGKTMSKDQWIMRHGRGFTLVELLIALTLSFFLLGAVVLVYLSGNAASLDSAQLSRMQENVRFASDYLIRDIRNAGFRDETVLKIGHEQQIREEYIAIDNDGARLRVRYAGRGHCAELFDDLRIVENRYFVDQATGQLRCEGRFLADTEPGTQPISGEDFSDPVGLVSGVTGVAFQLICPDGGSNCPCNIVASPDTSCIGVRIRLQLQGLRDGAGGFDDRVIELAAGFRNVILDRVNTN